ncbi:MAG: RelA/SpoT domain protein [Clostridia bacterium]|nr:RelA/SpoT domain protein [Clostridia bacterium]
MTFEEFYGRDFIKLETTRTALEAIADALKTAHGTQEDLQPIVYSCSRIKQPDSMLRKLRSRGLPATREAALGSVYDAVGLRIICSFASDVYHVVSQLERDPRITVLVKKDYLAFPKPNGYRSMHLCIRYLETGVLAEIQIRTIAMDFWATLEHQLKYKKTVSDDALIRRELKRCADEIASADLSMQTIREILKENCCF